ncbi:MAG TPA: hypothetical protein VD995_01610 [Azospirillum sp.]|nr:hypothetical protein [Azospirillum sp.]
MAVAVAAAAGMAATNVIASKGPRERPRADVLAVHTDAPHTNVVAVARSTAADPVPAVLLARADWESYATATRTARVEAAEAARAAGEARVRAAVDQAVAAMRAEIPAFIAWRFSFFTTYRLTFTALSGAVTGADPVEAARAFVAERFRDIVLNPDALREQFAKAVVDIGADVAARRAAFVDDRRAAFDGLAAQRALPPGKATGPAVVSEADALELPTPGPLRPDTPLPDPITGVGWMAEEEALVLAGRQAVRRGAGLAAEPALLATAPAAMLEAAPLIAGPAIGAVAFAAGLGVELAVVKLWEAEEHAALAEAAGRAVDQYRDALLTAALPVSAAIVAGSLGGPAPGKTAP